MLFERENCIPYFVEFASQFFHTFWGVMATYPALSSDKINATKEVSTSFMESDFMPAFQAGISVWMQIVCFWKLSPAHFNPAVSVGFLIAGVIKPLQFVCYVLLQVSSSTLAAFIAKLIIGEDPSTIAVPEDASSVTVAMNEMFMTGMLMFFILCTAMDKTYDQQTGAMAVGFTVFQGALSAKAVGVACLSPSRAIGPTVVTGGKAWDRHWLFWVFDLAGAAVATIFYMCCFSDKEINWIERWACTDSKMPLRSSSRKSTGLDKQEVFEENEMIPRTTL